MTQTEQLQDFDNFFYYGDGELSEETKSDVMQNILQPKRSLFYDRNLDSAGIPEYENYPISIYLTVVIPFQIVTSIAMRNQFVSNGEGDYPDRRVALSQATVNIERKNNGEMNITVLYIPLADFKETQQVTATLGAGT